MLAGQLLLSMGPALECGWNTQGHSTGENQFTTPQQVSTANSFFVRGGTLCPLLLPRSGIRSDASLCTSCACCHSLSEFMCASVLLSLKNSVSLVLFTTPGSNNPSPLPSRSLSLSRRCFIKKSHLGLRATWPKPNHSNG